MNNIHETAVVSPDAKLGDNITIGPYSIIEGNTEIGDNTVIDAHVKIARYTKIGKNCRFYLGALIGEEPQDHRLKPRTIAWTTIGDSTIIREYVTIHRSPFDDGLTKIGSHSLLMAFAHVGHDAIIGDHVTIANHTTIAGHVIIFDYAVLSAHILIHQFSRIGKFAMVGGRANVKQDIPPFCLLGEDSYIHGPNIIGLRRANFSPSQRSAIRKAIKIFFFQGLNTTNAIKKIRENFDTPEVDCFLEFTESTTRGMMSAPPSMVHPTIDI